MDSSPVLRDDEEGRKRKNAVLEVEYMEKKYLIKRVSKDEIGSIHQLHTVLHKTIHPLPTNVDGITIEYYDSDQNGYYVLTDVSDLFEANEMNVNPWKLRIATQNNSNNNSSDPLDMVLKDIVIEDKLDRGASGITI